MTQLKYCMRMTPPQATSRKMGIGMSAKLHEEDVEVLYIETGIIIIR